MRKLEWDTDFWGIQFFDLQNLQPIDYVGDMIGSYLIQVLADPQNLNYIHELEEKGFKFQEIKVTLTKKVTCATEITNPLAFKDLKSEDLLQYSNVFGDLFWENSRYNIFSKEMVNKFYYTWMTNSILGIMDDKCIGYYIEDDLAGFITYKIRHSKLIIGLFGIMPAYQGQGIAQIILNYANNVAINNNVELISVDTQGHNINALNAYIKNEFKMNNMKQWYYKKNF